MKMWKRKLLGVLLAAVMMFETMGLAMAAAPETMADKLAAVERAAYGTPQTGALLDRVNKLEKDFEGEHSPNESVMQRVDNLYATMFKNENGPSLVTRMNAIEWGITRAISMDSIQKRVSDMEITMTGAPSEGTYRARIDTLAGYAFGSKDVSLEKTQEGMEVLTRKEHIERFGQHDHNRLFGKDSRQLLSRAGFDVGTIDLDLLPADILPVTGPADYDSNTIFLCRKMPEQTGCSCKVQE